MKDSLTGNGLGLVGDNALTQKTVSIMKPMEMIENTLSLSSQEVLDAVRKTLPFIPDKAVFDAVISIDEVQGYTVKWLSEAK